MKARLATWLATPRRCAAFILLVYGVWMGAILVTHGGPYGLVQPGQRYVTAAASVGIHVPVPANPRTANPHSSVDGSDGQFTYYLALDLDKAKYMVDVPQYRYQRILEPLIVKGISLGKPKVMPWAMVLVGWLAVGGGTWALATWLRHRGRHPAWALFYGMWPGLLVTDRNDLTEGVAYGLVALAVLLLDSPVLGRRPRPMVAASALCLASFARQETAIYAVMMGLGIAFDVFPCGRPSRQAVRDRLIRAAGFLAVAIVPFCVYLEFLSVWLRGVPKLVFLPTTVPAREIVAGVALIIVPAVAAGVFLRPRSLRLLSRASWAWSTYCAHILFIVAFILVGRFGATYYSAVFSSNFRYFIPAALGAVLCVGSMPPLSPARWRAVVACGCVTMIGVPIIGVASL